MIRHLLVSLAAITVASCGSESTSTPTDCPHYSVDLDAGAVGFSKVGDYGSASVCAQYCPTDYPVCQLVTDSRVKCQRGCS